MNFSYLGTKGSVVNDKLFLEGILHAEDFMRLPVEIRPEDHTCAAQLDHFLGCIASGEKPLIDALDGARSVAVCCAMAESVETGRAARVVLDF
jgi:predicted dehydrogenase